jgi:DNA polymerase-3 subunit epsilon
VTNNYRAVALDVETTGIKTSDKHRIIEVGAVEIINRKLTGKTFNQRINPERDIDESAYDIHGISLEDLKDKPVFAEVAQSFLDFVGKSDIIGHNIGFDLKFLDYEYNMLDISKWTTNVAFDFEKFVRDNPRNRSDIDTMEMMKIAFPGKKKNLNALCDYCGVDRTERTDHGALLDAKLTALCWLFMTRGNLDMFKDKPFEAPEIRRLNRTDPSKPDYIGPLKVIRATEKEKDEHLSHLEWMMGNPLSVKKKH